MTKNISGVALMRPYEEECDRQYRTFLKDNPDFNPEHLRYILESEKQTQIFYEKFVKECPNYKEVLKEGLKEFEERVK
jgi:hypothetical protein